MRGGGGSEPKCLLHRMYLLDFIKTRSRDSINGRARIWDMAGGVAGLTEIILNPVNPKIGPML